MRAALYLAGFGCVALFCAVACGQASVDSALNEYNKKKAEIVKPVLDAYDAEIKAAQEKGDEVKAKQISIEKEAFIRREEPSQKLALNDAIREYQKRDVDSEGVSSSVQQSKLMKENFDWLDKNLSRRQIKLEFKVHDVKRGEKGYYYVYFGACETPLGGFVELRNPEYYAVKMSEKQAQDVGIDHRLVVSGTPEVGTFELSEVNFPVFFIDEGVEYRNSRLSFGIYM
ncbi:MAG: hypothetical protein ACK6DS_19505, partial [Planctomycetota bacterium]